MRIVDAFDSTVGPHFRENKIHGTGNARGHRVANGLDSYLDIGGTGFRHACS